MIQSRRLWSAAATVGDRRDHRPHHDRGEDGGKSLTRGFAPLQQHRRAAGVVWDQDGNRLLASAPGLREPGPWQQLGRAGSVVGEKRAAALIAAAAGHHTRHPFT